MSSVLEKLVTPPPPGQDEATRFLPRLFDYLLIVAFVLAIMLPAYGMFTRSTPLQPLNRNEKLLPFPTLQPRLASLLSYPLAYRDYFQQAFGGRQELVRLHALVCVKLLHVASSHNSLIGKNGWLFYHGPNYYHRTAPPFTPAELDAWQQVFDKRRDWLAQQGIRYLVVLVPEKYTIYPEYMPAEERPAYQISRLDQLLARMHSASTVPMLDLRPTLFAHKQPDLLYRKTDSHWNDLGGFYGYQAIIDYLRRWYPHMHPATLGDYSIGWVPFSEGDAAVELGLQDQYEEMVPQLRPLNRIPVSYLDSSTAGTPDTRVMKDVIITECPRADIPKVVILRDSFCYMLTPYLSQHFGRAVYLWEFGFNAKAIAQEHPDLVIQERVERVLFDPPLPPGVP